MSDAFLIGCHLSSADGYRGLARDALSIGANVFQFFTRNPRGCAARPIDPEDVAAFLGTAAEHSFGPVLAHAPYTLNACSANPATRGFARDVFADDLLRMENTPGAFYNFHPGSHTGQGVDAGIAQIAETLDAVMRPEQTTVILLETMAGKGSEVGSRFGELRRIIDSASLGDRLGVCLDTCHVHDAGYDIAGDLDGVLREFDSEIGLDRLRAIHLNDSKNPFSSHKDRHETIGGGSIGLDAFRRIINHPRLRGLPFYLETPQNDLSGWGAEIALLKSMREQ